MSRHYFSLLEVALHLSVSEMTIRRAVKAGRLKATIIGRKYRVSQEAINAFVNPVNQEETR
jgi:excisionase family DNA binding protein